VATEITVPQSDRLLLVELYEKRGLRKKWHQRATLATHTGRSKRDSYHTWGAWTRPSLVPTSCWRMCSCPWRAFRAFVAMRATSESSLSKVLRISEMLVHTHGLHLFIPVLGSMITPNIFTLEHYTGSRKSELLLLRRLEL
jgi:hypothetical protein